MRRRGRWSIIICFPLTKVKRLRTILLPLVGIIDLLIREEQELVKDGGGERRGRRGVMFSYFLSCFSCYLVGYIPPPLVQPFYLS